MANINRIENMASIVYDGNTINSNTVDTLLLLAPTILKSVDQLTASIGETLTYTVVITNIALVAVTDLPFADVIPEGSTYVASSFTLNGSAVTPIISDDTLTYTIPAIDALGTATITFQVVVVGGDI